MTGDDRGPVSGAHLTVDVPETAFGDGIVERLPSILDRFGVDRPLVVSDDGVAAAGVLETALAAVDRPVVHYRAATEPSTADFDDLPSADVDGVVAVGGGSCLDAGKVAALLLSHGGTADEYLGVDAVPGPTAPLVAVPTTSGTGSQATQTAVVAHDGVKRGISDEHLRPDVGVVDPALTFDLPRGVTARSGLDAFVHALESLTARDYRWVPQRPITYQGANPFARPLARRALGLVHGHLERATYAGDDRDARRAMALGSHLAGVAFSNSGLGAVHALASTVGGMTGRPHGECLAVSLRPGLEYNLPVREAEYAAVARHLGVARADATDPEAARALLEECDRLRGALGLPGSFEAVGLDADDADAMVENTLVQRRRLPTNPRTVAADVRDVLDGRLD
ncbi:iron-containing alcohol dehydrogenase [Halomarina pelagica]|uniref:iron-containing alcohol dehydrogenase n=1 Tax=Halomarina pelagica TaxID=2961599 RepID=UPI0020C2AE47|nr:iron-containing alcohol dehydrogenase [Halomarina sp. BND7]